MNTNEWHIMLTVLAVLWPILVVSLDRAYGRGRTDERLKNIENDLKELRDTFILQPKRYPPSRRH